MRVAIADDHAELLATLAAALDHAGVIEVVATATDAAGIVVGVRDTAPDVVLLDLRLGDAWGFDLVPDLRRHRPAPEVIVLSALVDESTQEEADQCGAFGQLPKGCSLGDIQQAVLDAGRAARAAAATAS